MMNKYFLYLKILRPNVKKKCPSGYLGSSERAIRLLGGCAARKTTAIQLALVDYFAVKTQCVWRRNELKTHSARGTHC